jgi:uncharacterized protein YceK
MADGDRGGPTTMVMMRGVAVPLMAISLALLGCSTMRPATPPPTGLMWGYRAEAEALPSLHMIFYATDRATCELNRAKDVHQPPKDIAWVGLRITSECRQIAVGSGGDFWVVAASTQEATGAPDRTGASRCATVWRRIAAASSATVTRSGSRTYSDDELR